MAKKQSETTQVYDDAKTTNKIVASVVDKATEAGKASIELATQVITKTASGGKDVAKSFAKGAKEISDKVKADKQSRLLKKLNPLFEEEYHSETFFVPNIICIVDDAVRRDIELCNGAIGWRENKKGTEILYLYDEFVQNSGLKFLPVPMCSEFYHVDSFDSKLFVKVDYIFQRAHEEKLAELEHIAYCLGAKSCSIVIENKELNRDKRKRSASLAENAGALDGREGYDLEVASDKEVRYASKSETKFKGNTEVMQPTLKWFANDQNILNLIDYRCRGGNEITSKTLELRGASAATMSRSAAYSIDVALAGTSIGTSQGTSMEDNSVMESTSKIIYSLEF